jgi:ATP-binding protein involved in chromosome partitioning
VSDAATELDGVESIDLEFTVMTDEDRENLRRTCTATRCGTAGSNQAHGHAEGVRSRSRRTPRRPGRC